MCRLALQDDVAERDGCAHVVVLTLGRNVIVAHKIAAWHIMEQPRLVAFHVPVHRNREAASTVDAQHSCFLASDGPQLGGGRALIRPDRAAASEQRESLLPMGLLRRALCRLACCERREDGVRNGQGRHQRRG